jgi:hypothetical protein
VYAHRQKLSETGDRRNRRDPVHSASRAMTAGRPRNSSRAHYSGALGASESGAGEVRLELDALYPYTADRLDWLASHLDRPGYCDEAAEEVSGPPTDILTFVARGMDRELREVFGLVRSKLEEIAEELDDADDR